jgi:hypothetical protein
MASAQKNVWLTVMALQFAAIAAPDVTPPLPPRHQIHALELLVSRTAESTGLIKVINRGEPEIKLWDWKQGYGETAYRLEMVFPTSGIHYIILKKTQSLPVNIPASIAVPKGTSIEIKFDIKDGTWLLPESLPANIEQAQIRAWYKPGASKDEAVIAGQFGVTLDCFVGELCKWKLEIPSASK